MELGPVRRLFQPLLAQPLCYALCLSITLCLPVVAVAQPVHILLTNDDGFAAPGIQSMHQALREAGYRVTVVAPHDQQSGTSMRVTLGEVAVEKHGERFWSISGSPADSVAYALSEVLANDPPDIVISGTNFGQNLGSNTNLSGTVGAALMATQRNVPAIAVSVGLDLAERDVTPQRFPSTMAAFPRAAAFTIGLLGKLEATRTPNAPLLPAHQILNVNYPAIASESIKGVRYAPLGYVGGFTARFVDLSTEGQVRIDLEHADANGDVIIDSDAKLFADGYITVSVIDGRLDAGTSARQGIEQRLGELLPR